MKNRHGFILRKADEQANYIKDLLSNHCTSCHFILYSPSPSQKNDNTNNINHINHNNNDNATNQTPALHSRIVPFTTNERTANAGRTHNKRITMTTCLTQCLQK